MLGMVLPCGLSPRFADEVLRVGQELQVRSVPCRAFTATRPLWKPLLPSNVRCGRSRSSQARQRLMTIRGVGQRMAPAFATIDVSGRFRRLRDVGAYLGLVPRRFQSGEIDYMGDISKCVDRHEPCSTWPPA
jgi:hypothetical protein